MRAYLSFVLNHFLIAFIIHISFDLQKITAFFPVFLILVSTPLTSLFHIHRLMCELTIFLRYFKLTIIFALTCFIFYHPLILFLDTSYISFVSLSSPFSHICRLYNCTFIALWISFSWCTRSYTLLLYTLYLAGTRVWLDNHGILSSGINN